jgi:8-amino-7-oxononanoate synthase
MDTQQWLRARIASILNVREDEVDVNAPFTRFGIDSVEALSITVELEDTLQRRLPTTLVWDYPTIAKLARYLEGTATMPPPRASARPAGAPASTPRGSTVDPKLYDISQFDEYRDLKFRLRLAQVPTIGNPYFKLTTGISRDVVTVGDREYINYATYNYLGLSGHPRIVEAARAAALTYGTSTSASRTTSGEKPIHRELERQLAQLLRVDDAICFVGGHSTNVSFIGKFLSAEDLILHDELAHDSILQGAKLSGAARVPFRHNDVVALEEFLRERRGRYRRVLIVVEGVYSTDGDTAPLREIIALKRRYGAMVMVDEAHSIGVLGARGGGLGELAGVAGPEVDIWMGTLSKSFASCGGYIAGSRALVELVKYTSPGFIYSVGMTPANAAMALEAIRLMLDEPHRVRDVQQRARFFKEECQKLGLDTGLSDGSAVVPVQVGDSLQCMRLAQSLFRRGINVTPMVHPAVRNDKARLRFFVSALHTEEQLRMTANAAAEELATIKKLYAGSFQRLRDVPPIEPANAAIAREGFEAFTKGDLSILANQLDEEARYFFPGRSPIAGYHNGRTAVLDFFASTFELTDGTLSVDLEDILSDSAHGVLLWRNMAYRGNETLDNQMCEILDVDDSLVVAATFYSSDQAALDKFLGGKQGDAAKPMQHMRSTVDAENERSRALRDAFTALMLGQSRMISQLAAPDAAISTPPEFWPNKEAATVPLTSLGEHLSGLHAMGCVLRVDLAVCGAKHAVVRVVASQIAGIVGSMCVVAKYDDHERIVSAWLATDAPDGFAKLFREAAAR